MEYLFMSIIVLGYVPIYYFVKNLTKSLNELHEENTKLRLEVKKLSNLPSTYSHNLSQSGHNHFRYVLEGYHDPKEI